MTKMERPTLVLIVRRDVTVVEYGVAVAHACEAYLLTPFIPFNQCDVIIKGARDEQTLFEVESRLGRDEVLRVCFTEEENEKYRLGGQLVSIGLMVQERDAVLALPALEGLHALEDLDGPKVVRVQCEAVWRGYRKKEADGSPWRCKNMCAPGSTFCSKKNCLEEREKLA